LENGCWKYDAYALKDLLGYTKPKAFFSSPIFKEIRAKCRKSDAMVNNAIVNRGAFADLPVPKASKKYKK
jgi:hypothetical protein